MTAQSTASWSSVEQTGQFWVRTLGPLPLPWEALLSESESGSELDADVV